MPEVGVGLSPTELNQAWRSSLEQPLSGRDSAHLAERLGVTQRTVQRWTTQAGEQRNPFPARLGALEREQWPATYQQRAQLTEDIARGVTATTPAAASNESFVERFKSLPEAQRWARDLAKERIDPWLSEAWRTATIEKGADAWEVHVTYERIMSPTGVELAA